MAKDKKEIEKTPELSVEVAVPTEPKVAFLTWFVAALDANKTLKPHHMTALKAYFADQGLGEEHTTSEYDAGLKKYGL